MDDIDINNIRYLQVLIPKLDDSHLESQQQDYNNINEHLLDNMMSRLLEDDSSIELPASMTGKKGTASKQVDKKDNNQNKLEKKYMCTVCKKSFRNGESLRHHNSVSGRCQKNVSISKTSSTSKRYNCLTCGQRFKDKQTMSFHCAARGHVDPNENRDTASKTHNSATSSVRKKSNHRQKEQKVVFRCNECSRRFKDTKALNFHFAMSGHVNSDENNERETEEDDDDEDDGDQMEENKKKVEKEVKRIDVTKLPCGSCNKKFKDSKSLDLHLALSGHSDKREKIQEKRQSEMNGKTKHSTDGKSNDKKSEENQYSCNSKSLNCNGCRKKFKSLKELKMHCALSGHTQEESPDKEILKNEKNKISNVEQSVKKLLKNGRSQIQSKKQLKHSKSSLICFECGKKFKTLEMLNYHEAFSGHVTQEESNSSEENTSDEEEDDDENSSGEESEVEQVQIAKKAPSNISVDIFCSVCNRKFKDKNALYYHMAISGHGASKLGSDRTVKVKQSRSRIADLTSSDSSSEESDSEESEESEEEEPSKNNNSRSAKSICKPRCGTCKKQFKDSETLEFHIALSGHSLQRTTEGSIQRKRGRPPKMIKQQAINASLGQKRNRGRPRKIVQSLEDENISNSEDITSKDQKRQCGECGRKCKDLHAYEFHCAMTGHDGTAKQEKRKPSKKRLLKSAVDRMDSSESEHDSEDVESSDDSCNSKRRRPTRKKVRMSSESSDDDEGVGKVRSYQSFMDEVSVWDKWNPKKGVPCRRCGLLFKRNEDLKRHLLTTSHKTYVLE
ncbi:transcriptional regulator ATRX-like [Anneissia japonica]|uniref:transcriptional regulator ATRX-like n=1 Tax=Anneissia japonica TaxID=1529436 RepID=UPI001425642D|nr:transcriptional regulator ATRX-like [Anneissia japonica]